MSSVSKSDHARRNDELRETREQYQQKEVEAAKKKAKEIARLRQKQNEEITKLTEQFDQRVDELRNRNQEVMTQKDQNNQEQVDQVRKMYMDQAKKKITQSESEKQQLKEAYSGELAREKTTGQQQRELLKKDFSDSIKERDRVLEDTSRRTQETMTDRIGEQREKLRSKFDREADLLRKGREQDKYQMSEETRTTKSNAQNQIAELRRKGQYNLDKQEKNFERIRIDDQRNSGALLTQKSSELKDERERMAQKLNDRLNEKKATLQEAHEKFQDQVNDRVDGELRQARLEAEDLKKGRQSDLTLDRRQRDIERRNIQAGYEERFKDLENQKNEIFGITNKKAHEQISTAYERAEKLVAQNSLESRNKMNLRENQSKEDRNQLVARYEGELEFTENRADKRYRQAVKGERENQRIQSKYFESNLGQLKEEFSKRLLEQREQHQLEMQELNQRLDKKFRGTTAELGKKMESMKDEHQQTLITVREKHEEELRRLAQIYEMRGKDREKAFSQDQKSIENKYESRMTLQEKLHRDEIDRLEKRHQEQMAGLANRMNALARKA